MKFTTHLSGKSLLRGIMTPHPARDWYVLVFSVFILGVVCVAVAFYFYVGIHSRVIFSSTSAGENNPPVVSRQALQDIVSRFEVVRVNYEEGNIRTSNVADPR